jgi:hypothetical protein
MLLNASATPPQRESCDKRGDDPGQELKRIFDGLPEAERVRMTALLRGEVCPE